MLLTIDVGNTNTVIGLFEGDSLENSYRVKTDPHSTADEIALVFRGLLANDPAITGISMCSTVPAVLREMRTMLHRYYPDVPTVIVEPGIKTGVGVLTDNPKEVGTDRIVNTLAAYTLHGGPSIVVDFGTSTNFDVVSKLRKVELVRPRSVIGKNTIEALQSGTVYGFAGQVDGLVDRITEELGGSVNAVIATGGLSKVVREESRTITVHEPALTLIGLRLVFEKNVN